MNTDRETYLKELSRIITQNFRPNDSSGSMTVAKVGLLTRQVLRTGPGEHGFAKLKDALLELERRGEIRTGLNSKQALAIWLPGSSSEPRPSQARASGVPASRPFRPLRKPLWLAFVVESPVGRRFVNKRTGEVLLGQEMSPEPDDEWIEIEKIPDAEEKADASQFIEEEGLQEESRLRDALASEYWYSQFPDRLRGLRPGLAGKWNRRRSLRVSNKAEEWRARHCIPEELVYQSEDLSDQDQASQETASARELREGLLKAVKAMETAELLELRIPARYLVRALRPDLTPHE